MQKAKLKYFKDRSLFYSTFPIRKQAQVGEWNFKLEAIYFVAILDFEYDEAEERRKFRRDVAFKDQDGDEVGFSKSKTSHCFPTSQSSRRLCGY